jgi:hypothetical protein
VAGGRGSSSFFTVSSSDNSGNYRKLRKKITQIFMALLVSFVEAVADISVTFFSSFETNINNAS